MLKRRSEKERQTKENTTREEEDESGEDLIIAGDLNGGVRKNHKDYKRIRGKREKQEKTSYEEQT